ncbi:hypothetical protein BH09SUM1_BH09SUM1_01540 [soil metagenome]
MTKGTIPHDKLMAYLDGELSPQDRAAFEALLEQHPEWREEAAEMAEIVGATKQVKLRPPDPTIWDNYWEEIDSRIERKVGWLITSIGAALLMLLGIWKVMMFAQNDLVRLGILMVVVGMALLFFAVIRGRLVELPKDRYRRIRK